MRVQRLLRGVNIAVVATIAVAAAQLARSALVALLRFRVDAAWLMRAGLIAGVIRWLGS